MGEPLAGVLVPRQPPEHFAGQRDVVSAEIGAVCGVMAIALHPYLTGVPYRIDAFDAALAYICRHPRVWRATGSEIARHYRAQAKA